MQRAAEEMVFVRPPSPREEAMRVDAGVGVCLPDKYAFSCGPPRTG